MKRIFESYIEQHRFCEACGAWVSDGVKPHHIKTRGAGGRDVHENLIRLCPVCHIHIHAKGDRWFVEMFPHCYEKISAVKPRLRE